MKTNILLLALCLLLFSCRKDASDQLLWQCDNSQVLDSAATSTQIVGSWRLVQQRLGSSGEVVTTDKSVIVTFNSDSTFTVLENSSVTTQGHWGLYKFSSNSWALDLTAASPYLYGIISFCDNKVLFTDSVVDGNDNLFEKTD